MARVKIYHLVDRKNGTSVVFTNNRELFVDEIMALSDFVKNELTVQEKINGKMIANYTVSAWLDKETKPRRKFIFFRAYNQATDNQIRRIKYEGFKCGLVFANFKNAVLRIDAGQVIYGEDIRMLSKSLFFAGKLLPADVKNYLVKTFIVPQADLILFNNGFRTHESEMMLNNLSFEEANIVIQKFVALNHEIDLKIINKETAQNRSSFINLKKMVNYADENNKVIA